MTLWKDPKWYGAEKRIEQLDDHIHRTGQARFGLKTYVKNEKLEAVIRHFNRVAQKYDFMNSLLSFGIHHVWKRKAVRLLALKHDDWVLDVCGGTGDLARLAASRIGPKGKVVIYDINRAMMAVGRQKVAGSPLSESIFWMQGNAEDVTFADNSFDAAMVGFGIRNLTHMKKGFQEMHRILKPGGKFLCLEFSKPTHPVFRMVYDFYSFNIMPMLGKLIVGSAESYACLSETIRMFPLPDELSAMLRNIGFHRVDYHRMTNGIAVAHVGLKVQSNGLLQNTNQNKSENGHGVVTGSVK